MINNAVAYIFTQSMSKNLEGLNINTYAYSDAIDVDFQPAQLTEAQLQAYGLSTEATNAKKMFFDMGFVLFLLNRVFCQGEWYEVRALNKWNYHQEAILAPVLSTINYTFSSSNISVVPTAGAIFLNGSKTFTVIGSSMILAAGKYSGTLVCIGSGLPSVSGALTKISGTGDATINYTEYHV